MSEQDFQNSTYPASRNITVFPDRRQPTEAEIISEMMERLMERMDRYDAKLSEHMANETVEMKAMLQEALHASFPEGDADGHRRHHEALIRKAEENAKFWHEMRVAVGKWAGLGLLTFLAAAAWQHFLQGPK